MRAVVQRKTNSFYERSGYVALPARIGVGNSYDAHWILGLSVALLEF